MTPRQPDLEQIFHAAREIATVDSRKEFLQQACAGDAELIGRVEALLSAVDMETDFLSGPAVAAPEDDTRDIERPARGEGSRDGGLGVPEERPGATVGPYKLLQQIGEGGFGVVYMAEQTRPVRRRVAVKVIKAGMDTKAVIARFEAERQALAMMEHPNIARVLDAGSTATGRPYFVMELVKGIPITEFCDEAGFDTRRRLELFVDVCRAVQHAHQKGIIHRDLKPSNVLVTLRDDRPMVKIIDFGIAKATEQRLTEKTLFTAFGQMVGTPAYMSPEQAVMSELDVDTRSDVYSLGVLLYELLTGSTPIDPEELRSAGYEEIRRRIREDIPTKPSTKLSTMAPDVRLAVAARRHAQPNMLARECHGDLDWIVLKALEKERTRRYQSPSDFADDVERHLHDEPVTAVAPSRWYRLRKLVVRNRVAVGAAAAVSIALIAGTIVSTWMALEARDAESRMKLALDAAQEERSRAQESAEDAMRAERRAAVRLEQVEKANEVLAAIFDNLDPKEVARNERPLQTVLVEQLGKAIEAIDDEEVGDALNVALLQVKLGRALRALGEAKRAQPVLEKALATVEGDSRAEPIDHASALLELALCFDDLGEFDRGFPLKERSLAIVEAERGPEDESTLEGKLHVAQSVFVLGRLEEALSLHRAVYETRLRLLGPDDRDTAGSEGHLALSLWAVGERALAVEHQEHVREVYEKTLGPDDPDTWSALYQLSVFYHTIGRSEEALELAERVWRRTSAAFGEGHPITLERQGFVASARTRAGDADRAVALSEETLRRLEERRGKEHPLAISARNDLVIIYRSVDRRDDALSLARSTYELANEHLGADNELTLAALVNLSIIQSESGDHRGALPFLRECVARHTRKHTERHPKSVIAMFNLAAGLLKAGFPADSAELFEKVIELREALGLPEGHDPDHDSCVDWLASAYRASGRFREAIPLLEKLLAVERSREPPDPKRVLEKLHAVAGACEAIDDNERSVELHEEMLVILHEVYEDDPGHVSISRCRDCLVRLYGRLGRLEEVRRVLSDAITVETKKFGAGSPPVAKRSWELAVSYEQEGRIEQALEVLLDALSDERRATKETGADLHHLFARASLLQLQLRRWAAAEENARQAWSLRREAMPESWLTFYARSMLGAALLGQERFDEAEPHLIAGYEGLWERRQLVPPHARGRIFEALERLAVLHEERANDGDADEAARYRQKLGELAEDLARGREQP